MKLLLDEMLSPAIAQELRARGHDVQAVAEYGDRAGFSVRLIFTFGPGLRFLGTQPVAGTASCGSPACRLRN